MTNLYVKNKNENTSLWIFSSLLTFPFPNASAPRHSRCTMARLWLAQRVDKFGVCWLVRGWGRGQKLPLSKVSLTRSLFQWLHYIVTDCLQLYSTAIKGHQKAGLCITWLHLEIEYFMKICFNRFTADRFISCTADWSVFRRGRSANCMKPGWNQVKAS